MLAMEFFRMDKLLRKTSNDSPIFIAFNKIEMFEYSKIVRFCQQRQKLISRLNFDEFLIIQLAFCNALFETKRYHEQIKVATMVIEFSISMNIQLYKGEDIYLKTLFRKAQSLDMIGETPKAIHIMEELLKMNPNNKSYQSFLKECYLKNKKPLLQKIQQYSISIMATIIVLYALNFFLTNTIFMR